MILQKHHKRSILPLFIILALPLLLLAFNETGTSAYIAFIFSILLPYSIYRLFKIKAFYFVLASFPILIVSIIYTTLALDYNSFITTGTWSAIFDSNANESIEFITNTRYITKVTVSIQIIIYTFYLFFSHKIINQTLLKKQRIIYMGLLLFFLIDFLVKGSTQLVIPFRSASELTQYIKAKRTETTLIHQKKNKHYNATRTSDFNINTPETIVVVIG